LLKEKPDVGMLQHFMEPTEITTG